MTITFQRATRTNVPLLLGVSGGTGSGKTYSAFELASGMAGEKPFAVIDTESGRARHYADTFAFDHAEIRAPFRPQTYLDAIVAAEEAGYPVVVVDSVSHVWSGEGGMLDWHEEEATRMAGDDWKRREAVKMTAWIKPKMEHKRMVQRLLQLRCHVILCFRAEPKVDMVRDERGKMEIKAKQTPTSLEGWIPICDKMLPYELTASFLLLADNPGVPKPIKLQEQHRAIVPLDRPLSRDAGRLLAEWAKGGAPKGQTADEPPARAKDELIAAGDAIAPSGVEPLKKWWTGSLTSAERKLLADKLDGWKAVAAAK